MTEGLADVFVNLVGSNVGLGSGAPPNKTLSLCTTGGGAVGLFGNWGLSVLGVCVSIGLIGTGFGLIGTGFGLIGTGFGLIGKRLGLIGTGFGLVSGCSFVS